MKQVELLNNIRKKFDFGSRKNKIIVFLGIGGMLLILLSELIPTGRQTSASKDVSSSTASSVTNDYQKSSENRLRSILSEISGVGKCDVMLTVDGSEENVYAENVKESNDTDSSRKSNTYENEIIMTEDNGKKDALVKKTIKPKLVGAIIVCEGGDKTEIKEKIIHAVSSVFGISSNNICVEHK